LDTTSNAFINVSNKLDTVSNKLDTVSNTVDTVSNTVVTVSNKLDTVSNTVVTVSNKLDTTSNAFINVSNRTLFVSAYSTSNYIAIGCNASLTTPQYGSISIGIEAGKISASSNVILIGNGAGSNSCGSNTIVLNASNAHLSPTNSNGFYVNPVRLEETHSNYCNVKYNPTSKEIVYQNQYLFKTNIDSGLAVTTSSNSNYLSATPTINFGFVTYSTTSVTIPVSGIYSIKAFVGFQRDGTGTAGIRACQINFKKNSSILRPEMVLTTENNDLFDRTIQFMEHILLLTAADTMSIVLISLDTSTGTESTEDGFFIIQKIM